MKDELIKIFFDQKLLELIKKIENNYDFGVEEDVSLKSLLLTAYLLTREERAPYLYFETIVSGILQERSKNHYQDILNTIIDQIFQHRENDYALAMKLYHQFITDGYCFHSFNAAFLPTIQKQGLVVEDKPWDNEQIEEIRSLFRSHHVPDVFGLYQGRKSTPLFFANNLNSSRFYAYSSPTWFRHFVSGGMSGKMSEFDKTAFFRRDYAKAKENVIKLIKKTQISEDDQTKIMQFFDQQWNWIATNDSPLVALVKREDLIEKNQLASIPILEHELAVDYLKRILRTDGSFNHIIKNNIAPEKIIIFPYDLSKIKEVQPEKGFLL